MFKRTRTFQARVVVDLEEGLSETRATVERRRVVVTGMGCITPYGVGVGSFWTGLASGRSAIGPLESFDPSGYQTRIAGEARDFRPKDFLPQREISGTARATQLGLAAARMALDDAVFRPESSDSSRVGVFVGTSIGAFRYAEDSHAVFLEKGIRRVHPLFPAQSYPGVVATQLAISLGLHGPALCITTACTSSSDAIGIALMHLRSGLVDRAVVGGTEAPLTPLLFASFDRLGVMSRRNDDPEGACRPFDDERDGFVLSEGAAMLFLETEDAARERGATPLAEISGYGATSDAHHPLSPAPDGADGLRAIAIALEAAGKSSREVDHVSAHAIGSVPNDPIELEILVRFLGDRAPTVPVTAIKSMIGHTMGAAGAIELLACIRSMQDSLVPPTANLHLNGNRSLNLITQKSAAYSIACAVAPTFGFGSRNAVLVVQRPKRNGA